MGNFGKKFYAITQKMKIFRFLHAAYQTIRLKPLGIISRSVLRNIESTAKVIAQKRLKRLQNGGNQDFTRFLVITRNI